MGVAHYVTETKSYKWRKIRRSPGRIANLTKGKLDYSIYSNHSRWYRIVDKTISILHDRRHRNEARSCTHNLVLQMFIWTQESTHPKVCNKQSWGNLDTGGQNIFFPEVLQYTEVEYHLEDFLLKDRMQKEIYRSEQKKV